MRQQLCPELVAEKGSRVTDIHSTQTFNFAVKYTPGEQQGALARLGKFSLELPG